MMEDINFINLDFIKKFTKSILITIQKKIFNIENSEILSSDLVLKLSNELMEAIAIKQEGLINLINLHDSIDSDISDEINKESLNIIQKVNSDIVESQIPPKTSYSLKLSSESFSRIPGGLISNKKNIRRYGKINTLLADPMINIIQCPGVNQEISVIKRGVKQITKIVLSQIEIQEIIEQFSQDSHIPLIEGPFNFQINDLNIYGINSSMIGSSFIIKRGRNS